MSSEGIRRVAYYKEAELEHHRHLSMALAWEAEKLSRLKHFIDFEQQEREEQTTRAFEEAVLFARMVTDRDAERASQDLESITSIQQEEATRVKQLNDELDELDIFLPSDVPASDLNTADTHTPSEVLAILINHLSEIATMMSWHQDRSESEWRSIFINQYEGELRSFIWQSRTYLLVKCSVQDVIGYCKVVFKQTCFPTFVHFAC